jgi:putative methyltransferase (TIGR04325 family)
MKIKLIHFVLPIFILIYRKIVPKKEKVGIWAGDFTSWEEAQLNCSGYDSDIILEKCKNALLKVKNKEAVYERDSVLFDKIQYSWGLLAGLQKVAIENNNNLNVLDFGGSLGSTYYQNKAFLSGLKKLGWNIVEQAHFVDCGKQNFENEQLNFYHTIEECTQNSKPNVLLLSSVLQYLENPNQWIEKFNNLQIEYVIIDRTAFIDSDEDVLTIQNVAESIYKASYPAWFFNEEKLIQKFNKYEFTAFNSFVETQIVLNNNQHAYWKGFILKLKK